MKNIHILPTDKPSRLSILNSGKLNFGAEFISSSNSKAQNIYITNDEEIKEGDIVYSTSQDYNIQKVSKELVKAYQEVEHYKKIILTTDQDLIKDGVQAIDDEFLEWFVKNPSCEEVEVQKFNGFAEEYLIIIPKEEPKQECKGSFKDCFKPLDECVCDTIKQKTLEEAIENRIKGINVHTGFRIERSYSEEEVLSILQKYRFDFSLYRNIHVLPLEFSKWFEQFKKK